MAHGHHQLYALRPPTSSMSRRRHQERVTRVQIILKTPTSKNLVNSLAHHALRRDRGVVAAAREVNCTCRFVRLEGTNVELARILKESGLKILGGKSRDARKIVSGQGVN